jgi:hypothetical protein
LRAGERRILALRQDLLATAFAEVSSEVPYAPQRCDQADSGGTFTTIARPLQRCSKIGMLELEPVSPLCVIHAAEHVNVSSNA